MRVKRNYFVAIATANLFLFLTPSLIAQTPSDSTIWRFDNIDSIGGHTTHVLGHPHLIESPYGNAIGFNGVDDALFVDVHPLAGRQRLHMGSDFSARRRWRRGAAIFSSRGN